MNNLIFTATNLKKTVKESASIRKLADASPVVKEGTWFGADAGRTLNQILRNMASMKHNMDSILLKWKHNIHNIQ